MTLIMERTAKVNIEEFAFSRADRLTREQMHMKKKTIGITTVIIIMASLLTGCGEHIEENEAGEIYESEPEISQTDRQTEVSTEVEEAPQTANSNETEEITDSTENEPDEENGEESVVPFVDEELYLYIKGVYDEIDWDIQFLPGDESKYDLYREQFIKLLQEEIPVVDEETGREIYISNYEELSEAYWGLVYDPNNYSYYFYDVDGDGTPELGVADNERFVYIFKYDEEADRVVIWDEYYLGMSLMGTGKFNWWGVHSDDGMLGLDQNGDYTFLAWFKAEGNPEYDNEGDDVWAYYVALPDYVEPEEWMFEQATYMGDIYPNYFFRLTEEQFDELKGRYLEACHESYREKEEVTYTYEELLNLRSDIVYAKGAEEYQILTKRYERWPDYHVLIEWPKITGAGNQQAYDNINYILERDIFRHIGRSIRDPEEFDHVLQGIADMKGQSIVVSYELTYQDDRIFCVDIKKEFVYYVESGECYASGDTDTFYVFDINTGEQLDLSDFIEIDRRIVDYVADDYQLPYYDSPCYEESYSFMDAFEVYEDEKYEHHGEMNVEEALEALRNGEISWCLSEDKTLVLYGYYLGAWDSWVCIPYSYIEEFAYY